MVLVIHEIFGVHEHIKDVCRRLAKLGYYAIAPELFARQGDAAAEKDMDKLMPTSSRRRPTRRSMSDLDATLAFAKASGKADMAAPPWPVFAGAGGEVWLYAERHPKLKAGVAWYGPLAYPITTSGRTIRPTSSRDSRFPCSGSMAGRTRHSEGPDRGVPGEARRRRSGSKIIVYDDAGHAFFADYRPSYVKADAEASWKEATAWLKAHGV